MQSTFGWKLKKKKTIELDEMKSKSSKKNNNQLNFHITSTSLLPETFHASKFYFFSWFISRAHSSMFDSMLNNLLINPTGARKFSREREEKICIKFFLHYFISETINFDSVKWKTLKDFKCSEFFSFIKRRLFECF